MFEDKEEEQTSTFTRVNALLPRTSVFLGELYPHYKQMILQSVPVGIDVYITSPEINKQSIPWGRGVPWAPPAPHPPPQLKHSERSNYKLHSALSVNGSSQTAMEWSRQSIYQLCL